MPVVLNDPHALTIRTGDEPYGCSNSKRADGYYMENRRYLPCGKFVIELKYIKHTMSTTCRYDHSLTDRRCAECTQRGAGEAYSMNVRQHGS